MSAALIWRLNLIETGECAEVRISMLDEAPSLPPTARDLGEAPGREPLRSRFFARRAFARNVLASKLGVAARDVTIGHDEFGAPIVVAPETGLHISTTGRENFCAVGMAKNAIGVDMEPLRPIMQPAYNVLHEREIKWLANFDGAARHEAFLRLWTAKEAYLKALRAGLSREPSHIEIVATEDDGFAIRDGETTPTLAAAKWRRVELDGRDFLAACVVLLAP